MSNGNLSIPYDFIPREYQLAPLQALDGIKGKPETKKKRVMLVWHRRSGKDKFCFCYMVREAMMTPGNYFYVFPTKEMARKALWNRTEPGSGFKLLDHILYPNKLVKESEKYVRRVSNQEMIIELENNSTIQIIGYDKNPDSIRGVSCTGAVFSEFAFSDPDSYKTLVPAIREANGWAIFNSTVNGRNHFYDMYEKVKNSDRWFVSVLQTVWPDKPGYTGLVNIEDIPIIMEEEGLTQEEVDREYGSCFNASMRGSYYADQIEEASKSNRISSFLPDTNLLVDTFWDLGVDDNTAVWFKQSIGNKHIFIDFYQNSGRDLSHYVRMLEDKGYRFGTHYLPHDAQNRTLQTGKSTAEIFTDLCTAHRISDDVLVLDRLPVQDGINATRKLFPRCCFDEEKCEDGIRALGLYRRRFDKKRNTFMKEPLHDSNSDAADAFRMFGIHDEIISYGPEQELPTSYDMNYDIYD